MRREPGNPGLQVGVLQHQTQVFSPFRGCQPNACVEIVINISAVHSLGFSLFLSETLKGKMHLEV